MNVDFVVGVHAIEFGLGAHSVGSHAIEDKPVSDIEIGHEERPGDDIVSIASHSEETA